MKKCNQCGEVKPFGAFAKEKHKKDGYSGKCKACRYEREKQRLIENGDGPWRPSPDAKLPAFMLHFV